MVIKNIGSSVMDLLWYTNQLTRNCTPIHFLLTQGVRIKDVQMCTISNLRSADSS